MVGTTQKIKAQLDAATVAFVAATSDSQLVDLQGDVANAQLCWEMNGISASYRNDGRGGDGGVQAAKNLVAAREVELGLAGKKARINNLSALLVECERVDALYEEGRASYTFRKPAGD